MVSELTDESRKVRITINEREFGQLVDAHTLIGEIIETCEILADRKMMERIKKGEAAIRRGKTVDVNLPPPH